MQDAPKMILAIAIAFLCLPGPEGNSLLCKTSHTLDTRLTETKLEMTWKLPSWMIIVLNGDIPGAKGENQPINLPK